MVAHRVHLFRAKNPRGSRYATHGNIAHVIRDITGDEVRAYCGFRFHTSRSTPTDHNTTMCRLCMKAKDREDKT